MARLDFGNEETTEKVCTSEDGNTQESLVKEKEDSTDKYSDTKYKREVDRDIYENYLSSEEYDDPNKIKVTIADSKTPILILFGPPACGKTMTLIRLTRFLNDNGYKVEPVKSFRPSHDANYKNMCDQFGKMVNSEDAAHSTAQINFMLVMVSYQGKPLCQILEGPGEYYFNPRKLEAGFPKYVHAIINSPNRKIWSIMLEPDHTNVMSYEVRREYVKRISELKKSISTRDKVIFLFNKIDTTDFVIQPGRIKYNLLLKDINGNYPGIFKPFKNNNPITKLWKSYNFVLLGFQTGSYSEASDGILSYEEGSYLYPKKLWEILQDVI